MPESVERAVRAWASPLLLALLLLTICSYLWVDQARRMDKMADKLAELNDTVITLRALAAK